MKLTEFEDLQLQALYTLCTPPEGFDDTYYKMPWQWLEGLAMLRCHLTGISSYPDKTIEACKNMENRKCLTPWEFRTSQMATLDAFCKDWEKQSAADPDQYPPELEDAEWLEALDNFISFQQGDELNKKSFATTHV